MASTSRGCGRDVGRGHRRGAGGHGRAINPRPEGITWYGEGRGQIPLAFRRRAAVPFADGPSTPSGKLSCIPPGLADDGRDRRPATAATFDDGEANALLDGGRLAGKKAWSLITPAHHFAEQQSALGRQLRGEGAPSIEIHLDDAGRSTHTATPSSENGRTSARSSPGMVTWWWLCPRALAQARGRSHHPDDLRHLGDFAGQSTSRLAQHAPRSKR